ncbi:MAG: HAMP domain-containing histidine kinase [Verrucomicrobiae bacterium]|nr:HAMP domain-containing histidine kinase [Verrucomicrobiae bacterium]
MSVPPLPPPEALDGFLAESLKQDEESFRRGRLHVRFGVFGGALAIICSAFYFFIGHPWGGAIVAICGLAVMQIPWLVRKTGNLSITGHLYGGIIMVGLTALCVVSGGLEGSAYAWLAAVPACVLLLMNLKSALIWSGIGFAMAATFVVLELSRINFPTTYPPEVATSIIASGNIGLILFLALLALLFEKSRIEAFERMEEANAKLAEANQELIGLNRQKHEFLNIAAHDLKNPITIICGYADLLRELESPTLKEIHGRAAEILRSGNHMLEVIHNILEVRAIEDGRRILAKQRVSIHDVVEDLVVTHSRAANQKNISLENATGPNPPEAWADPGATRQVLDHLISNAIKYTPPEGSVWITVEVTARDVVVEVSDTGPGLSQDEQKLLWEKFTRLTPRPTGDESSNGLGLWISQRLAREMGGRTFCRSVLGAGSTFGVRLPLWMDQEDFVPEIAVEESADGEGVAAFDRLIADIEERAEARARAGGSSDVALPS